jgi:RHS repeat-associated protein
MMNVAKQILAILLSYATVLAQSAPLGAQSRNVLLGSAAASRVEEIGRTTLDASAVFPKQKSEASAAGNANRLISSSLEAPNLASPGAEQQSEATAAFTVSPTSLKFSRQLIDTVSVTKPVTITNGGASVQPISIVMSGDYTEKDNCSGSVAAGGSCTVNISFAPTQAGAIKGAASIYDNNNNLLAFVGLTGTGGAPVTAAPAALSFTGGTIGTTSAPKTFKITNTTTGTVTINSITTNVTDYAITTGTCLTTPLAPKTGNCIVTVTVTPTSAADDGSIIITDNAPNALPLEVKLSSAATAGTASISLSKLSLAFKTLSGTTSAAQTLTVTNTSASAVTMGAITASTDYSVLNNNCPSSLAAAAKCTFQITFSPTFIGSIQGSAAVAFTSSSRNSPQLVKLTGTSEAGITVAPASLTFPSQGVDTSSTAKSVKITNNSASAVTLSSVVPSGDFQIQLSGTTCPLTSGTLLAGKNCTIEVQYSPTTVGSAVGALTVTNNAGPNPLLVPLAGTGSGTGFTLSVLPSSLSVAPGSNGTSTISVADVGGFTGSASLTASGLPTGVTASFSPSGTANTSTLTLTASSSAATGTVPVTVTGTSGTLTQTVKINLTVAATGGPPTITGFSPGSGPEGTLVTLSGTNFTGSGSSTPAVTLAHQGGGSLAAPLSSFTATSINFVIPSGAATGDIKVAVGTQSATSTTALSITPPSNFTITAAPSTSNLIQGQSTTFAVTLNSANGFTGLSTLSVTGLPSGVTASFSPSSISANQTSILTLSAPASQPTSTSSLSVSASATIGGQSVKQTASVSLKITGVTTTFLGRTVVDNAAQTPLAGVVVSFLGVDDKGNITGCAANTASDASGNFVLTNLPTDCTGPQLVGYNGLTATSPAGQYAGVNLSYTIVAGQVTTSPVLINLPRIDNAVTNYVTQNASVNQVFTYPTDPNVVITVYAGTTFTLSDGTTPNPFPLVAVEVPVDRLPDAMPSSGMLMPFIVAFQPANATASQPVAVDFPNLLNIAPGGSATLMTLDPTHGYMVSYGTGSVSTDGSRIVPNADPANPGHLYGLVHFDWHGPTAAAPPPASPGPPPAPPGECMQCPCNADPSPPAAGDGAPGSGGGGGAGEGSGGGGGLGSGLPVARCGSAGGGGAVASDGGAGSGGSGPQAGDPIDLSSGLQVERATDIALNGGLGSIYINRIFRTMDTNPGPFGIGTNHNYSYLLNTNNFVKGICQCLTLVMPDGNQYLFTQTGTNTFSNSTIPTLIGSQITIPSSGVYNLRWKNGTVYQFGYGAGGGELSALLISITDRNGNAITVVRGNVSQPIQITQIVDPVGRALNLTYDSSNRVTLITDPIGRTVQYTYNSQGTLATVTNAAGGVTSYTYDTNNNLLTTTDARGVLAMQDTYDANGRVIEQMEADGGVIKFAYTLLNSLVPTSPVLLTVVTDALGNQTSYRFDSNQNLLNVTDATGQMRVFTHSLQQNNLVTSVTGGGRCPVCGHPDRGDVTLTYDSDGNILTRTDSLGDTTAITYDPAFNHITSVTDQLGNVYKYAYDASGNMHSVRDPNGNISTFVHNPFGLLTQITDPLRGNTSFAYDSFGNNTSVTDPVGNTTTVAYDALSRPIQTIDALSRKSAVAYDALDRTITLTNPQGNSDHFAYDAVGDILSVTDAKGNSAGFTYDGMQRLITKTDALGHTDTRTYDQDGNLVKFVDRRGQTSDFAYDLLNRLLSETYLDSTVSRSYDSRGRLVSVNDSLGGAFGFSYDVAGRLLTSSSEFGTVQHAYDADGRVASRTVVGQSTLAYSYDPAGNLLQASMPQASASLAYDADNRLVSLARANGVTSQYSYDSAGEVLSIAHSGGQGISIPISYSYDSAGQRTIGNTAVGQPLPASQAVTSSFDAANRLVTTTAPAASTTYVYDADGNLTSASNSSGTTQYTWDSRNRLQSIVDPSGQTTSFVYDFGRNLISRTDAGPAANLTQNFVLDALTNVAYISRSNGDNLSVLAGQSIDQHLAVVHSSGEVEYGLSDAINSTIATTDQNGNLLSSFFYEPFGQVTTNSSYPFQFTGRSPVSANLYYYRARYYDTGNARFLQEDTLGFSGGQLNLYVYAANNPISLTDPFGETIDWGTWGETMTTWRLVATFIKLLSQDPVIINIPPEDFAQKIVNTCEAGAAVAAGPIMMLMGFAQDLQRAAFGNRAY